MLMQILISVKGDLSKIKTQRKTKGTKKGELCLANTCLEQGARCRKGLCAQETSKNQRKRRGLEEKLTLEDAQGCLACWHATTRTFPVQQSSRWVLSRVALTDSLCRGTIEHFGCCVEVLSGATKGP